jgi:hypothetical protein
MWTTIYLSSPLFIVVFDYVSLARIEFIDKYVHSLLDLAVSTGDPLTNFKALCRPIFAISCTIGNVFRRPEGHITKSSQRAYLI